MSYSSVPFSASRVFYPEISGSGPDTEPEPLPPPSDRQRFLDVIKGTVTAYNTRQVDLNAIWHRNSGSVSNFSSD